MVEIIWCLIGAFVGASLMLSWLFSRNINRCLKYIAEIEKLQDQISELKKENQKTLQETSYFSHYDKKERAAYILAKGDEK